MDDLKPINSEALQPKKSGNSWGFRIKTSKIDERVIDPEKSYLVFAKEVDDGKDAKKCVD